MKKKLLSWLTIVLLLAGVFCFVQAQGTKGEKEWFSIPTLTEEAYNAAKDKDVFVILAGASWCGYCKMASFDVFSGLLEFYSKNKRVHVVKADLSAEKKDLGDFERTMFFDTFGVQDLPVILVVQDGQVLWGWEGYTLAQKDKVWEGVTSTVKEALKSK